MAFTLNLDSRKGCLHRHLVIVFNLISWKVIYTDDSLTSQSGTNIFLKTSVCAIWSQQLHDKNMINSSYNKSLRKFSFGDNLLFCGFLDFFLVGKPCFWSFLKIYFLVTQILQCLSFKKIIFFKRTAIIWLTKNLKWNKIHFLYNLKKNIARIAKSCPKNISSVVDVSICFY